MSGFRPAPKSGGGQNFRSKATAAPDGGARSTEPRGFKRPTKPTLGRAREHRDRPEALAGEEDFDRTPPARQTRPSAAGFARATDLAAFATTAKPKAIVTAEGPLAPGDWRIACMTDADGRCAVTGEIAQHHDDPTFEVHHVIPKGLLRQRGLGAWVWDQRIGLVLRDFVHHWFDDGTPREIPLQVLRPENWEVANEIDEHLGTSWASEFLIEHYPSATPAELARLRSFRPDTPETP